jgi:hypothetical protein
VVAVGVLLLAVATHEVLRRRPRTRSPAEQLERANRSLAGARKAAAAQWAPAELARAEEAARGAWAAYLLEASRLEVRRDFRSVVAQLAEAEALSTQAERAALRAREDADAEARAELTSAQRVLQDVLKWERVTSLPPAERARLQRARLRLREATALLESGNPLEAAQRAAEAGEALRNAMAPTLDRARRFEDRAALLRWRQAVRDAHSWSRATGRAALLVLKAQNRLELVVGGRLERSYDVDLGANGTSDKLRAGDLATPEGQYRVIRKLDRGASQYYRALVLDYPNPDDRRRFRKARAEGALPPGARIGGHIEIHGEGGRGRNWTRGCVAVSNPDMDDLFPRIAIGTPVTIVGSDGSSGSVADLPEKRGSEEGPP